MIYDAENVFFSKKDLSGGLTSDVIYNGGGDAYTSLWLSIMVDAALAADANVTINTSDQADMSGAAELLTVKVPKAKGSHFAVRLPKGALTYLQLSVAMTLGEGASASGTMTAALVQDTELE